MPEEGSLRTSILKPRQFLGPPRVVAPRMAGHVSATVQFIVPGLAVASPERKRVLSIFDHLGVDVHAAAIERVANEATRQVGTLVSATFHVAERGSDEAIDTAIDTASALLVERFLGMVSFLAGVRCVAVNAQTTRSREGATFSTTLEPSSRSSDTTISLQLTDPFGTRTPPASIFNALLWLRRGLAARDPLDTYGALMISLQAIARELVGPKAVERRCPQCGTRQVQEPSVTTMVRELVVGRVGAPAELFASIWKARNAALADGDESVTAETLRRLTELKLDAATLCYKGIKLAMGMPIDGPPQLDPSLFVTSALMDVH